MVLNIKTMFTVNNLLSETFFNLVNGNWSVDGQWSPCSGGVCGVGIKNRTRTCTNPQSAYGGADCTGDATEVRACDLGICSQPRCPGMRKNLGKIYITYLCGLHK